MTLAELRTRPEYVTLTALQKAFTVAFCSNGADKIAAARTAHPDLKNIESVTATAHRHLRHPQVKKLINDFYGRTDETGSKSEALAIIWKKIQAGGGDDKTLLDYMKLYGEWKGFKADKPEETDEEDTDWAAKVAAIKGE